MQVFSEADPEKMKKRADVWSLVFVIVGAAGLVAYFLMVRAASILGHPFIENQSVK